MFVFAVVSAAAPDEAVEVFIRRKDAERFVEEVRDDESESADLRSIEPIDLDA